MPKANPKHTKATTRSVTYARPKKKISIPKKPIIAIGIIAIFTVSMISILFAFEPEQGWIPAKVEVGDEVTVEYIMWIEDKDGDKLYEDTWKRSDGIDVENPYQEGSFSYVVGSTAGQSGVIKGFHDAVLTLRNETKWDYFYLPECVDDGEVPQWAIDEWGLDLHPEHVVGDGYDDRYDPDLEIECLSYGRNEPERNSYLKLTPLVYKIRVVNLVKAADL